MLTASGGELFSVIRQSDGSEQQQIDTEQPLERVCQNYKS